MEKKLTSDNLEKRIKDLEKENRQLTRKYTDLCIRVRNFQELYSEDSPANIRGNISFNQTDSPHLIPMCASCKKVRDSHDEWHTIEKFIQNMIEQDISHGLCPECAFVLYPEVFNNSVIPSVKI